MLGNLKFLVEKIFSSKFILRGACKKCGSCCRNIVFYIGKETVKTEEQFESLIRFNKSYSHFIPSGKDSDGSLLFTCKSLNQDNTCSDYFLRSIECRRYPKLNNKFIINGGKLLDNCGYSFDVDKKFEEYLKQ